MTKHYYAEYCPYGTTTICPWGDKLLRFDSKFDRDDFVRKVGETNVIPLKTREINCDKYDWRSKNAIWDSGELYAHLITGYYQELPIRSDYIA